MVHYQRGNAKIRMSNIQQTVIFESSNHLQQFESSNHTSVTIQAIVQPSFRNVAIGQRGIMTPGWFRSTCYNYIYTNIAIIEAKNNAPGPVMAVLVV